MTASHKLVITLPDEYDLDTTDGTITMTVTQAREWAQSIIDVTPHGTTKRERAQRRNLNAEQQGQAGYTPPKVDNLARTSGLFRKR